MQDASLVAFIKSNKHLVCEFSQDVVVHLEVHVTCRLLDVVDDLLLEVIVTLLENQE